MINQLGMKILQDSEGCELTSYKDEGGVWTIGIGSISYPNGKSVGSNETCTMDQALEYLNFELDQKIRSLNTWSMQNKLTFSQNQQSALLCFAYNLGMGPIIMKGFSLNLALISGDEQKIRDAFALYVNVNKKFLGITIKKKLPGLVIRRQKESDLFFTKDS